jgi:hypothetical protein
LLGWSSALIAVSAMRGWSAPPAPISLPDTNPTFNFSQFSADKPIRMIAYGDMRFTDPAVTKGTNPRVRRWLAERVGAERPEVLLLTGDMPFTGANYRDWQVYAVETASWRADGFLTLPTLGNHEIYGGAQAGIENYLRAFPAIQNRRYYSALIGNVEVISLDATMGVGPPSQQGEWFAAQLGHLPSQVQFLFILYHVPWVADRQSQMFAHLPTKEALTLRGILEAHLAKMHARVVVFNGHIHNYERFERLGVEYVITGGGGAEPYPLLYRGKADQYQDPGFPVYHYLTLEVSDGKMHATMWKVRDPEAAELSVEEKDEFTLQVEGAR